MNTRRSTLIGTAIAVALFQQAAPSLAQTAAGEGVVEEIIVTGIRASIQQSLDVKRDADARLEVVTAEDVGKLPALMGEQITLLTKSAHETADAMSRLWTLRDLEPYWIEVNRLENEADRVYRKLLSRLFSGDYDALTMVKLREVADGFEEAADALEHVAHAVETIAVKES